MWGGGSGRIWRKEVTMIRTHFMTLLKELILFFLKKNKSDSSGTRFIIPILLGKNMFYTQS